MATVLSAEPVARMYSLKGLKARQLTSAWWASTTCWALEVLSVRVSQLGGVGRKEGERGGGRGEERKGGREREKGGRGEKYTECIASIIHRNPTILAPFQNSYTIVHASHRKHRPHNYNIHKHTIYTIISKPYTSPHTHIMSCRSSLTEPKMESCSECQATSSTTLVWPM